MQFDVVLHRLEHEFGVAAALELLPYCLARRTDEAGQAHLAHTQGVEVLTRTHDDELLALFADKWRLHLVRRNTPDLVLETLVAAID